MDRETPATLHRSRVGRADKMIKGGSLVELVRQFQSLSPTQQAEYFIMIGPAYVVRSEYWSWRASWICRTKPRQAPPNSPQFATAWQVRPR